MFGKRRNYPAIEHKQAGWRAWENEDPQPQARMPWTLLISTFACMCILPTTTAAGWMVYRSQPEPTPLPTVAPTSTPIQTDTPMPTPTATLTLMPTMTPTNTPMPPTATATATPTFTPTVTPTNTVTPTFTPTPERGIISRGPAVNLRAGPGTVYDIRTTIEVGSVFTVVFIEPGSDGYMWYQIIVDNGTKAGAQGWIRGDLMEVIQ